MVVRGVDLDGFDGERFGGVLGEHRDEDVVDDFCFGLVGRCDIDEDVAGFGADFGMVRVDYWGH